MRGIAEARPRGKQKSAIVFENQWLTASHEPSTSLKKGVPAFGRLVSVPRPDLREPSASPKKPSRVAAPPVRGRKTLCHAQRSGGQRPGAAAYGERHRTRVLANLQRRAKTLQHISCRPRPRRRVFLILGRGCSRFGRWWRFRRRGLHTKWNNRGEVLKLLEIRLGCRPAGRAIDHHAGCRRRRREHPMEKRIPASMRTRQSLSELIEGRLASPDGRAELVRLATRLIVVEALEAECRDALGRDYYERGAEEGRGPSPASRTTSRRASPTCACRSPTAARSAPQISSSGSFSRSAAG